MILRTSKGKGNVDEEEARYLLPAGGNVFKTKRGRRLQSAMLPKKSDLPRFHQNKQLNKYYSII